MFDEQLEMLIDAALADGVLTDKEKQVLYRKAENLGVDLDEFEIVLNARLLSASKNKEGQSNTTKTTNKIGDLKKCPACGALISSGLQVCPECNYAFNESAKHGECTKKLQQDLLDIDKEYMKVISDLMKQGKNPDDSRRACAIAKNSAIMNTLIESTRSDLLELLAFSRPKANKKGAKRGYSTDIQGWFKAEDFGYAYWTLFCNCINMSRQSFSNDKAFAPYFEFYAEETENRGLFARLFSRKKN